MECQEVQQMDLAEKLELDHVIVRKKVRRVT